MINSEKLKRRSIPAVKRSLDLIQIAQEEIDCPTYGRQVSLEGIKKVRDRVLVSYINV